MKSLIASSSAVFWFALCIGVALILLMIAIVFKLAKLIGQEFIFQKISLPQLGINK